MIYRLFTHTGKKKNNNTYQLFSYFFKRWAGKGVALRGWQDMLLKCTSG